MQAESVTVLDKQLKCQHCGNETLFPEEVAILFSSNMRNNHVACFVCAACTHIHLFKGEQQFYHALLPISPSRTLADNK